jgi:methylmalonyl-CoA mutase cobalamin-binding subunit
MLTQLLEARGFTVRTISNRQTTRAAIGSLDLQGCTVIALAYLELAGSPATLRYLIKRLRAKAPPHARVIAGMWLEGEAALSDADIQRAIGSDRYVHSLGEAVEAIAEEAALAAPVQPAASEQTVRATAG